jgi:hypothetical protein
MCQKVADVMSTAKQIASREWFPHLQLVLKLSTALFQQQHVNLSQETHWVMLSSLIFKYRVFWQIAGGMSELDELSP